MNIMFHLSELGGKCRRWKYMESTGYGGITCDAGENTEAYLEYAVHLEELIKYQVYLMKIIALI